MIFIDPKETNQLALDWMDAKATTKNKTKVNCPGIGPVAAGSKQTGAEIGKLYNITGIPTSILIAPDKKIVEKDVNTTNQSATLTTLKKYNISTNPTSLAESSILKAAGITQVFYGAQHEIVVVIPSKTIDVFSITSLAGKTVFEQKNRYSHSGIFTFGGQTKELAQGMYLFKIVTEKQSISQLFFMK